MSGWTSASYLKYLCIKDKIEEEGAELNPAEIYGNIPNRSGENSQSLSDFLCLYLVTNILLTLGNEIIMFH